MYKVYMVTNLINSKRYVGITKKSVNDRFIHHCSQGFHLTSAIKKYGRNNFKLETLAYCSSKEIACLYEIKLIKKLNTKVPNGYNFSEGGECPTHTQEVKDKISMQLIGKKKSPEHTKKIQENAIINGLKRKGIARSEFTDEWKLNISKGKKGTFYTQEHKNNISKALRNSEKFKNANKGKHFRNNNPNHNPIIKELIARKKWKPVYCETLNISFLSIKHASEYLGIKGSQLNTALFRDSKVKGLKFNYIEK